MQPFTTQIHDAGDVLASLKDSYANYAAEADA